jgi:hypothetical protein
MNKRKRKGTTSSFWLSAAVKEQLEGIAAQRGVMPSELLRLGVYLVFLQHAGCPDPKVFSYWLRVAKVHGEFLSDLAEFGEEKAKDIALQRSQDLARAFPGMASKLGGGPEQEIVTPVALAVEKATVQN